MSRSKPVRWICCRWCLGCCRHQICKRKWHEADDRQRTWRGGKGLNRECTRMYAKATAESKAGKRKTGDTKGTNFHQSGRRFLTTEAQRRTDGPSYSPPPAEGKNQENHAEKMNRTKAPSTLRQLSNNPGPVSDNYRMAVHQFRIRCPKSSECAALMTDDTRMIIYRAKQFFCAKPSLREKCENLAYRVLTR